MPVIWSERDIDGWRPELKPLTVHTTPTLRDAFNYYRTVMLGAPLLCPLGFRLELLPRHFFALICQGKPGRNKGWVKAAKDTTHALTLIADGSVGFSGVEGCEPVRVKNLPLFADVIRAPHLIAEKTSKDWVKLLYLKRYHAPTEIPRAHVAVVFLDGERLVPASFHPKDLSAAWLNANASAIRWQKK